MMRRQTILKRAALHAVVVGILIFFSTSGYTIAEINQQNDIKNKDTELSSRPSPHNNYNPSLCNPLRRSLCNFEYYVGFDLKRRRMPYEKNLGSNIMPKVIPEYGVFVGVKFNEYFGLEFGYEWSKRITAKAVGLEGETVLAIEVDDDHIEHHALKYKMKGYSIHAILYSPILNNNHHTAIGAFFSIGLRKNHLDFVSRVAKYNVYFPDDPDIKPQKLLAHRKYIYIPEMKAGLVIAIQSVPICIKPYVSWAKTSKTGQLIDNLPGDGDIYIAQVKNSTTVGCMFSIKF